jgi:hypothetical protein
VQTKLAKKAAANRMLKALKLEDRSIAVTFAILAILEKSGFPLSAKDRLLNRYDAGGYRPNLALADTLPNPHASLEPLPREHRESPLGEAECFRGDLEFDWADRARYLQTVQQR